MAKRRVSALDRRIQEVKTHVEKGIATEEEYIWLIKIEATIALYGKPYLPRDQQMEKRRGVAPSNPREEKRRKRRRVGQYQDTPRIERYHHPYSRRGI